MSTYSTNTQSNMAP